MMTVRREDRGMFRVYRCPSCHYVGYDRIESDDVPSECVICGMRLSDSPDMIYVPTLTAAEDAMRELVMRHGHVRPRHSSLQILGVKRRVEIMIRDLISLNRGRPVLLSDVLAECADAGISPERAIRFIDALEAEGRVHTDGVVVEVQGGCDE